MLLQDFYTFSISQETEGNVQAKIEINKNHAIFDGHFVGLPIVPGVCQVQMITEILSARVNKNLRLVSSRFIKFLYMINPLETTSVNADITYKTVNDTFEVNAVISNDGTNYLKLRGVYCEA